MKTIDEIAEELENDSSIITEAALNPKQIIFTPVKLMKGDMKFGICVGNIFTIKQEKYCTMLENSMKINFGLNIGTGINKAKTVVKQASTKLIYLIYNQNNVMICNADICKPLDGSKLQ